MEYIEVSRFPPRIFLRVGPSLPLSLGALTQLTVTQAECCTCVDMDLYRDKGSRDPNYFLLSSFVEPFRSSNPRNRASTRSTDRRIVADQKSPSSRVKTFIVDLDSILDF